MSGQRAGRGEEQPGSGGGSRSCGGVWQGKWVRRLEE